MHTKITISMSIYLQGSTYHTRIEVVDCNHVRLDSVVILPREEDHNRFSWL